MPGKKKTVIEEAIIESIEKENYIFKLFVSGNSLRSKLAIANAKNLFDKYLRGRYQLKIIDVNIHPELTLDEDIIALPTLIKTNPLPKEKVIGDLSDTQKVINGLNIF